MNTPERNAFTAGALRSDLNKVEIDIRYALSLARVALETMAQVDPETHVRILNALDDTIDNACLEETRSASAVASLLTGFKNRLTDTVENKTVVYLE